MYYNGDIITMEGDSAQYAEAVVVQDGKILFVGLKAEAMKLAGEGHQMGPQDVKHKHRPFEKSSIRVHIPEARRHITD